MESLRETLISLAQDAANRSATARLNDVFDEVEQALAAGVRRNAVVAALRDKGISMTLKSFDSAMGRLRKRRATRSAQIPASPPSGLQLPATGRARRDDSQVARGRATPAPSPEQADKGALVPSDGAGLPDGWLDAELTQAQYRLLSPAQKRQKREAEVDRFFPNSYKKPTT